MGGEEDTGVLEAFNPHSVRQRDNMAVEEVRVVRCGLVA